MLFGGKPRIGFFVSMPISMRFLLIVFTLGYIGIGYVSKNWDEIKAHYFTVVSEYAPDLLAEVSDRE